MIANRHSSVSSPWLACTPTAIAFILTISCSSATYGQDPTPSTTGQGTESGTGLNVQRGNPLAGLFTPQPQYPTPQTILNPEPKPPAPGELNPLKGLFTPQPQYPTPQSLHNPDGEPPAGEVNHLKSVFTPTNQWSTPQTKLNPEAVPHSLVPERQLLWGNEDMRNDLIKQHNLNSFGVEDPLLIRVPPSTGLAQPGNAKPKVNGKNAAPKANRSGKSGKGFGTKGDTAVLIEDAQRKEEREQLRNVLKLVGEKNNKGALDALVPILQQHPDNAQAHYVKAVTLVNLRRYDEAAAEYKAVIEHCSSEPLVRLARGGLQKIGQ